MGLRPGKCYRIPHKPAFTRLAVKVHKRNYIGAAPGLKTRQFNMGNPTKEFSHILDLVSEEYMQIRDNALEALRIAINRHLNKKIGKDAYFLKIRVYPFQVLRENKQAQGAGADRVTKGMSHPYGKPIGRAFRTRPGKILMSLLIDEANLVLGKKALLRAKAKVPCKVTVRIGTDVKSIGTKPTKTREEKVETVQTGKVPTVEAGKEGEAAKTTEAVGKAGKAEEPKKELKKGKSKFA